MLDTIYPFNSIIRNTSRFIEYLTSSRVFTYIFDKVNFAYTYLHTTILSNDKTTEPSVLETQPVATKQEVGSSENIVTLPPKPQYLSNDYDDFDPSARPDHYKKEEELLKGVNTHPYHLFAFYLTSARSARIAALKGFSSEAEEDKAIELLRSNPNELNPNTLYTGPYASMYAEGVCSLLTLAISRGAVKATAVILDRVKDTDKILNTSTKTVVTPLILAACCEDTGDIKLAIVNMLLGVKLVKDSINKKFAGRTQLEEILKRNYLDRSEIGLQILQAIIKAGATVTLADLEAAVELRPEIVPTLLADNDLVTSRKALYHTLNLIHASNVEPKLQKRPHHLYMVLFTTCLRFLDKYLEVEGTRATLNIEGIAEASEVVRLMQTTDKLQHHPVFGQYKCYTFNELFQRIHQDLEGYTISIRHAVISEMVQSVIYSQFEIGSNR